MKHVVFMCLALYIHTTQSEILKHQSSTEGTDVSFYCKNEGKVMWSKYRDGQRVEIITAENTEQIQKPNPDPDNRYSVLDDLSLHIKKVSLSDSGIYYCNANSTVNLTVTASDKQNSTTSSYSQTGSTTATPESSSIAAAVSGGVVLVVLSLLLWTCIKRKAISAALSNKNENIYETVEDGDLTAQPAPSQKLNDNVYYLAGDPNIVKLGQRQKTEDHTYTLISESQSIENITSQRPEIDDSTYTLISGIQSKENITGQRQKTEDHTYTLISESQSIGNITSQRPEIDDSTYTLISGIQSKENITGQRSEIDDPTYSLISGIQSKENITDYKAYIPQP